MTTKRKEVAAVIAAAAATGALLTGCGAGTDDSAAETGAAEAAQVAAPSMSPSPSATASALTEDQAERKALVPKAKTGYDEALRTAVAAVPKSKPVSIELKGPANQPSWQAEVATTDGVAHTVRIDAANGKAGPAQTKSDQDSGDRRELADRLDKAKVTAQQAAQTATGKTKGTVTAVELGDTDNGTLKWSVDVVSTTDWNKTTYDIDATNRKILREHVDRD
ncbi:PepSY domain-containing protein [Streptomyces sp. LP11]|uniref:PepSY domain-containing protein n=1 Tax=Streptomyces pyxinicus TaxID=2970331 RepID=A0ABT2B3G1_9ACTN|nr:PepSY domain-containing protein [Streptomyces sp. LP11]MCS0603049.1 PepSY domain-containing protein [Streptomyces sp. LP11]